MLSTEQITLSPPPPPSSAKTKRKSVSAVEKNLRKLEQIASYSTTATLNKSEDQIDVFDESVDEGQQMVTVNVLTKNGFQKFPIKSVNYIKI
jgi:hypothetical protein